MAKKEIGGNSTNVGHSSCCDWELLEKIIPPELRAIYMEKSARIAVFCYLKGRGILL